MRNERLVKARKDKGLTQQEICAILKMSLGQYSRWECGLPPAERTKKKLAKYFQMEVQELFQ